MEILNRIFELLKDLGIFTIIVGFVTYLIQNFIRNYFDNQADLYKTELQKNLQQYKSELEIRSGKVSKFHDRRLEIISRLYEKMSNVKITLASLTSTLTIKFDDLEKEMRVKDKRQKDAQDSYEDFLKYYHSQRIFIPKETCKIIDELSNQAWSVIFDYQWREDYYGPSFPEQNRKIIEEINQRIRKNIPKILEVLEDDFRLAVDVESV